MPITHAKVATLPDDASSEVKGSDWNDDHVGGITADQQAALDAADPALDASHPPLTAPGLRFVGPFPVAYDDPAITDGIALAPLAVGEAIVGIWAVVRVMWTVEAYLNLGVGMTADDFATFEPLDNVRLDNSQWPLSAPFVVDATSSETIVRGGMAIAQDEGVSIAAYRSAAGGGSTAGLADIYAIIATPIS